jgi:hypothetical protein
MKRKKTDRLDSFLTGAEEREALAQTIADLRGHIGRLERRNNSLRSNEWVIKEAVTTALEEMPRTFRIPTAAPVRKGKGEEVAILHLSDIQLGKITRTYNSTVADERVQMAMRKTIQITDMRRNNAMIRELHVYLGGDMVEGEDIFPHQAHLIDSPLFDQACINGPSIFTRAILTAMAHFEVVKVFCVYGNHGRNGGKHTRSHPKTNWDRVFYHTLRTTLLGTEAHPRKEMGRLEFFESDEFWLVDRVFAWGNLIVHGHQITGGFAGFPWYGTAKKAWGWIDSIEEPWDNLYFGHFHTPAFATLGGRVFYANGTTESDNEFAKETLAACGVPSQRLQFMNADHGVISDDMLMLVDRKPNALKFTGDEFTQLAKKYGS